MNKCQLCEREFNIIPIHGYCGACRIALEAIEKKGLVFSHCIYGNDDCTFCKKTVEPMGYGENYYFINTQFEIAEGKHQYESDAIRIKKGNGFRTKEAAENFLNQIKELLKK